MPNRGAVLGLFPALQGTGGIQRASRHLSAVLASFAEQRGWTARLLSLNDPRGEHADSVGGQGFRFRGFARSKWRFAMAALAERQAPRAVVAAHPNLAPIVCPLKTMRQTSFAVVGWGIDVWDPLPTLRRKAVQQADFAIVISRYTAERTVQAQGVSPDRIRLLPLALDPAFWEAAHASPARSRPAGFPEGRVLLSVTRLAASEGYKGVDLVIAALPLIAARVPDVHYVVVGDGDDRPRLEELSRQKGLAARVHFLGRLDSLSAELAACYSACDVFVLPSRGEGFGIVFLEAMAFAKPVVGGAHGGTLDVIEDGRTGMLVPPGDVEQLARVLESLLTNRTLRDDLGRRARERVQTNFLFEHFRQRLAAILDEMVVS